MPQTPFTQQDFQTEDREVLPTPEHSCTRKNFLRLWPNDDEDADLPSEESSENGDGHVEGSTEGTNSEATSRLEKLQRYVKAISPSGFRSTEERRIGLGRNAGERRRRKKASRKQATWEKRHLSCFGHIVHLQDSVLKCSGITVDA
jgi:hypothetical protein